MTNWTMTPEAGLRKQRKLSAVRGQTLSAVRLSDVPHTAAHTRVLLYILLKRLRRVLILYNNSHSRFNVSIVTV